MVVWQSLSQDGSSTGIFGQLFPAASIADASKDERDNGSSNMQFVLTLSSPADGNVAVDFTTTDGSASSASDFTATAGTAMMAAGEVQTLISVPITGDTLYEHHENFTVNLSNPTRSAIADATGTGTIVNDDPPPSLSINDMSVTEGNAGTVDAVFDVSISEASGVPATVEFMTFNGSADAGKDYGSASGMLVFPAMSTAAQQVHVGVFGDLMFEHDEDFFPVLLDPVDATISVPVGQGTIVNDDGNFLVLTGPAAGGAGTVRRYQGD